MAQVARAIGVTAATVSLALKEHPRISKKRREEIRAMAARMGYRPNAMATALAQHRHQSRSSPTGSAFAWINAWPHPKLLRQLPQFDAYWRGAFKAAEEFGYRLEEFTTSQERPLAQIGAILRARNVSGVLIPPHAGVEVPWHELNCDRLSVVRFGLTARNLPPFHSVTADQAGNAYESFVRMTEKGYRRIGFAGVSEREWRGLAGFAQAQFRVPEGQRVPPLLYTFGEGSDDLEKPLRWLKKHRPDAVLIEYKAFFDQLQLLGHKAPAELGLATTVIPDIPVDTGIDQNPEEIGRVALLLLLSQIRENARGVPPHFRQITIQGTWKDGTSLPARH